MTLCEVLYSQPHAASMMKEASTSNGGGGMMLGPDMFHVLDEKKKVRINIWQVIRNPGMVEVVINDENEQQIRHALVKADEKTDIIEVAKDLWNAVAATTPVATLAVLDNLGSVSNFGNVWVRGKKYGDIVWNLTF